MQWLYETDILMLCQRYRPALEPIFEVLGGHVDGDSLRELRNISSEIQGRIARMGKNQK